MSFSDGLAAQAERQWAMFRATVERLTDDQWYAGDNPGQVPAWQAFHALLWAEYYVQADPKNFNPRGRFGVSDRDAPSSLPSRTAVLAYIDEVAAQTDTFLRSLDSEALLAPEPLFPWTGATVLERVVYTLRHTTYHLGELSATLRLHGAESTEWQ